MKDIIAKMAAGMGAKDRAEFEVYVALLDPNPAVIFWGKPKKNNVRRSFGRIAEDWLEM